MRDALVVVPLAATEWEWLTLHEWDLLTSSDRVLFEDPGHPLVARLRAAGVEAGPFDDEPDAAQAAWALVADPPSPRVRELADAGATVTSGAAPAPDAVTAAQGAPVARRAAARFGSLALVMARLRGPGGCPWDAEQTHESLRVHLLEEAHEVLEAIDEGAFGDELEEELGDLLLQVVFHAQLAADDGRFDVAGVAERIVAKLLHRHPHVFGDVVVGGAADVVANWEAIKAREKESRIRHSAEPQKEEREGPFDGIPPALPGLLAAYKTQKRAAALGFRPDPEAARRKVEEALAAPPGPESLGEALFWLVAVARSAGVDPEGALAKATLRFRRSL
ncbi:MAG: MazG family protein [Actinomycetota bacterium]|nr:MazG family protein [Actinomycetota bacterium]